MQKHALSRLRKRVDKLEKGLRKIKDQAKKDFDQYSDIPECYCLAEYYEELAEEALKEDEE